MILLLLDTLLAVALLLAWGMATWRVSRLGVRDDGTRFRRTARTGMIFLTLGMALGVARLITTGLLWFTSGWWFAADRVLLALPLLLLPIIAALVLSGPRLRRLARIAPESPLGGALREAAISPALVVPLRVAALAAAIGAYCALPAPPPAPYWRATAVFAGLLALVVAVSWSLLQRRCLQRRLPARREQRKRPIFVRALGTVLVAFALIATWGGGSALASRLPDRYSMTGHETDDWGGVIVPPGGHDHGQGARNVTTLTGPQSGAPDRRFTLTARTARVTLSSGAVVDAWTFDGQVPGPELRVRQGDLVEVTLVNENSMRSARRPATTRSKSVPLDQGSCQRG